MKDATLVLVTPLKIKPNKKTHIKIVPPSGYDFDFLANSDVTVEGRGCDDSTITWKSKQLISSNKKWLKYSIKCDKIVSPVKDLPDAGTITVTLPKPPAGVNPVVTKEVDYVDEVDEP